MQSFESYQKNIVFDAAIKLEASVIALEPA